MDLHRLRVRPVTAWRTPWQADTLFGLLCWACARRDGGTQLQSEIIEPALQRLPPFVVSDAFPGDWLPVPTALRSSGNLETYRSSFPDEADSVQKLVRKARWIHREGFIVAQRGGLPTPVAFSSTPPLRQVSEVQNQIGRESSTTSAGGQLFVSDGWSLADKSRTLTIYVRTTAEYADRFVQLVEELSQRGFGADVSTGRGEFEIATPLQRCTDLEKVPRPTAAVVLSTFQPAPQDPTDGYWEAFVKYGKLGPDYGIENVFKRPLVMFRPGAVFVTPSPGELFGRAIPWAELLSASDLARLRQLGATGIHPAFGLAVPTQISHDD